MHYLTPALAILADNLHIAFVYLMSIGVSSRWGSVLRPEMIMTSVSVNTLLNTFSLFLEQSPPEK